MTQKRLFARVNAKNTRRWSGAVHRRVGGRETKRVHTLAKGGKTHSKNDECKGGMKKT